ncbi:uncharacterized protein LOC144627451 [Crassostrea virginica]
MNMPKSKRASTTSNSMASGPKAKRKRHPPSDGRPIPKAQDTVPLLPPHLNTDSEAPSVTPADNAVSPSQVKVLCATVPLHNLKIAAIWCPGIRKIYRFLKSF